MEERIYDFWVAALQDGYINDLPKITEVIGGAKAFFEASYDELKHYGLSERLIKHISNKKCGIDALKGQYEGMCKEGIDFVTYKDSGYPLRLLDIPDKPYGLFYKGNLPADEIKSVALIGARNCSEYGRLMAEYYGDRLAAAGVNIISGMAYGIDGIAQMAAIDAGGQSYGILGCGVDIVYPKSNERLYERLCQNGSGLISEYAPGTKAASRNFPPRNRIISALSDVVIVVEAKAKSGTLITVNMALEQNREVMVVPGRVTDPLSIGCLNLINNGAGVALGAESVLDTLSEVRKRDASSGSFTADRMKKPMGGHKDYRQGVMTKAVCDLDGCEKIIWDALDYNPKSINEIADKVNLIIPVVLTNLTHLEMRGYVKDIGSGYFARIV